ncbi:hypothetical protein GN316_17455 [Xylophilus sp. Kf1]|nr:hypothetical protein [Xylophilus sp. Kf1]
MRRLERALPGALLALAAVFLAGCAAPDYPVRDDHDHTPGPPLMPAPVPQSDPSGG